MRIYSHLSMIVKEELFNKIYIFLLLSIVFSNEFEISPISQCSPSMPVVNYNSSVILNLGLSYLDYSENYINNNSFNYSNSIGFSWLISSNLSLGGGYINYRINNNENILKLYYDLKLHFNNNGKYINTVSISPISTNKIIFNQNSSSQYSFGVDVLFQKIFDDFMINIGNYYIYGEPSYNRFDVMIIYQLQEYINLILGTSFTEYKFKNIFLNIGINI